MYHLKQIIGKQIDLEISGGIFLQGILVDLSLDIIVLYNGKDYLYIPHVHIQNVKLSTELNDELLQGDKIEVPFRDDENDISYRKTLLNAKGRFVQIYIIGDKAIHGYITNILNDYFVFYSPVYKTMLISLNHLKWLIPYRSSLTPYTLGNEALPVKPTNSPMQRSLEEQLKKCEGSLVILDCGDHPMKIGLLKQVQNSMIQLVLANGEFVYWKISHIKAVYFP